ncbi:gamma-aminobutyric acid type B receptor subunit 1-like [Amphiura filiformis]|uniref:gamma-aminobutyric acid type B receptor subunit 1-like n=1 Tax=Amphiura filiformis TaxID=82378 RepID=UPI003B20FADE
MTFENKMQASEFAIMLQAAANHINNMTGILDGYYICFKWDHAKDTAHALGILYDYIYNGPPIPMMFGPPYSSVSTLLNPVAGEYNIIQVTVAGSPALRDRSRYPFTLQAYPLENDMNPGRVSFIKLMRWKKVAIVFHDIEYFRANMHDLIHRLHDAGISTITVEAMSDPDHPEQHIRSLLVQKSTYAYGIGVQRKEKLSSPQEQVQVCVHMKTIAYRHDARIIIIAMYENSLLTFACKAYEYGMYGQKYVLILPGWHLEDYALWHDWTAPCGIQTALQVLQYSFYTHAIRIIHDLEDISYNGIKHTREQELFWTKPEINFLNILRTNGKRINYDSMFLMALALNQSISDLKNLNPPRELQDFNYADDEMAKLFDHNVRHADFTSISVSTCIIFIILCSQIKSEI